MNAFSDQPAGRPAAASPAHVKLLAALVIVLVGVVAWDVYLQLRRPDPPSPDVQARVAALLLFDAARAIEAQRAAAGSLPGDLSVLALPNAGYRYARTDTGYTVSITISELSAEYRSGDDLWRLLEQARVR